MKEFLKQNWPFFAIVLGAAVMVNVALTSWAAQDQKEAEKAIRLMDPPAEIVEGRVEKIVTVTELNLADGVEQADGTAYLCSGQVWPIPDHQLDEISEWLRVYAPNRGCN